ncbi:MAG: acyl-CoA thioesterase [Microthrixaceae bacterium]
MTGPSLAGWLTVTYTHHIRVRYGEVDMQRVVFNANFLAYCDDAADLWFRMLGAELEDDWWDVMVKKAVITWSGAARVHDDLAIEVSVRRWGNTSFDVGFDGTVDGAPVFSADITYVAVKTGTTDTVPVPDEFRAAASGPVDRSTG